MGYVRYIRIAYGKRVNGLGGDLSFVHGHFSMDNLYLGINYGRL